MNAVSRFLIRAFLAVGVGTAVLTAAEPSYIETVADTATQQTFDACATTTMPQATNQLQATHEFIDGIGLPDAAYAAVPEARVSVIIATVVAGCALPIAIVWLMLHYRLRIERMRCRVIEQAIREQSPLVSYIASARRRIIRSALCWIGVGIGTALSCLMSSLQLFFLGLIPLLIGLAQLASVALEQRYTTTVTNPTPTDTPPTSPTND